jgi:hypothetical protein
MVYPTLKGTVLDGKIQLIDEIELPENALVLVTVVDDTVVSAEFG